MKDYTYKTKYLGSKAKLIEWIWEIFSLYIEKHNISTVADLFAGTNSVAYHFKRNGLEVTSNDFLKFNYYFGKTLIENQKEILNDKDIALLLSTPKEKKTFVEREFTNLFFPIEDTVFLDDINANIPLLENEYKIALAYAITSYSIIRRAPYGRFTTSTMSDLGKRPIKNYFLESYQNFNDLVINKPGSHFAYHEDATDLIKRISVDSIYIDPPYGGKNYSKYEHYYSFVETYVNYWENEEMIGKLKQVKKKKSQFSLGKDHDLSFETLFFNSQHVPIWFISYNNNGGLSIQHLKDKILKYKENCDVHELTYSYANGVSDFKEYLIVAY